MSKGRPIIQVAELTGAPSTYDTSKPFFLLETYFTSEGPRTRICSGRWATFLEAEAERIKRTEEMEK